MIADEACGESDQHAENSADRADYRAFDDEHQHHAEARCTERAEDRNVAAAFDNDEYQHSGDVECRDRDD